MLARGPSPRTPRPVEDPARPLRRLRRDPARDASPGAEVADAARRFLAASPWPEVLARGDDPRNPPSPRTTRLRLTLVARFTAAGHPGRPTKIQWVGTEEHDGQGYGHPGER